MDGFGAPLLPSEAQHVLDAQAAVDAMVEPARRYGTQHPLEYVGVWIEGSVVVIGFRDHLVERRAEVAALFGDRVEARATRYTRLQLQGFMHAIDRERRPDGDGCDGLTSGPETEPKSCREREDWFRTIGVDVRQVAIDEMANVVWMSYEAATQGAEPLIRRHSQAGDWLRFRWEAPS